jgi:hypothetical protein
VERVDFLIRLTPLPGLVDFVDHHNDHRVMRPLVFALEEILDRFPEWEVDIESARLSSTSTVRDRDTMPAFTW